MATEGLQELDRAVDRVEDALRSRSSAAIVDAAETLEETATDQWLAVSGAVTETCYEDAGAAYGSAIDAASQTALMAESLVTDPCLADVYLEETVDAIADYRQARSSFTSADDAASCP